VRAYNRAQQSALEHFLSLEESEAYSQDIWGDGPPWYYPCLTPSWEPPCPSCGYSWCTHCVAGVVVHCCDCGYHINLTVDFLKALDQVVRNQVVFTHLVWAESARSIEGEGIGPYLM